MILNHVSFSDFFISFLEEPKTKFNHNCSNDYEYLYIGKSSVTKGKQSKDFDNYLTVVVELDINLSWQPEVALLSDLLEDVLSLSAAGADEGTETADVEPVHVVPET